MTIGQNNEQCITHQRLPVMVCGKSRAAGCHTTAVLDSLASYACHVIALRPALALPIRNEGKRKAAAAKQVEDHAAESKLTSRRARTRQTIYSVRWSNPYYVLLRQRRRFPLCLSPSKLFPKSQPRYLLRSKNTTLSRPQVIHLSLRPRASHTAIFNQDKVVIRRLLEHVVEARPIGFLSRDLNLSRKTHSVPQSSIDEFMGWMEGNDCS
ncbi:hypothetical protein BDV39DRAFT_91443 [Aspergillus sergii]|uniref:Uncharacterized protein n=1 Tax=Aspergillus sergii TaxID=1034303 RepID=A0A5N6XHH9_9EURO|nr:hypothetical protein BDV39DRAFT_91443 [Aspergillus sergii]